MIEARRHHDQLLAGGVGVPCRRPPGIESSQREGTQRGMRMLANNEVNGLRSDEAYREWRGSLWREEEMGEEGMTR